MAERQLTIGNFQSGYPQADGITSAVQGMSQALAHAGHRSVIYGYGRPEARASLNPTPGLETFLFTPPRNPFRASEELRRRLKAGLDKLDLLVIHGMFNPPNIAIARCAARWGIPYVVCPHCPYDPLLLGKSWLRKAVYGFLFERPALRNAAAVQVFCQKHADLLRHYGIATPAIVVPNGFDPADVPEYQLEGVPLLTGDPKLLFLGRLDSHHKGIDLLIEAFARAFNEGSIPSTTVLTLVGPDAGDNAALQRIVREYKVEQQVVFTGRVVDPARWLMLKTCDLFVLGSRYDGFAMAVTEAMLAGKPLLLSAKTANSDWIRDASCAVIVEPSVEAIAAGLIEAIRKRSEWVEMGRSARAFALTQLTWRRAADSAAYQYSQLLDSTA